MFLKALKPSWRKLFVAAGIYFMVLLSVGADKAIHDASRKHLASTPEVQRYLAEIQNLYRSGDVEAKANELRNQLLENTSLSYASRDLELKVSLINWMRRISTGVLCYLLACIACTGASARKS